MSQDCCWNCKHYIPPHEGLMLDGPISSVCIVDRDRSLYPVYGELSPGDKEIDPSQADRHCCEKYEERGE